MFKKPIQHIPLKTMEEVQNYSIRIGKFPARPRTVFTADFSTTIIFYTDENGMLWITPYRFDIDNLLHKSLNFLDDIYFLPSEVYSEQISSAQYKWLEKIADEENWACTYEQAYQMAKEKGIKPIVIGETITLKQIVSKPLEYHFGNTVEIYNPLVNQFLTGGTRQNIGTYIHLSSKSLLVCDEYGRTFYITVNGVINDIENQLIDAGYMRTMNPERYVISPSNNEASSSNNQ